MSPKELGYKDTGDRVIVINHKGFGEHGVVKHNDGFGEVAVELDNGSLFHGYEGRDLIYEDEPLPEKPEIPDEPSPVSNDLTRGRVIGPDGVEGFLDYYSSGEVYSQNEETES